ncbi:ankyrin-1-like [Eucalyptus grandis]|uniref:ankyrin-1-like n=1 Tax=Eucalyptus grandis TaxID=71139 RepID=UPI00192EB7C0|nr:ankyrin-1-like [Eucalyptus grandis]
MDAKLSIDLDVWKRRKQSLEALIGDSPSQQQENPEKIMDHQLYSAAKEGDVDKLIKALKDHCAKEGVTLPMNARIFTLQFTQQQRKTESEDIVRAIIDFVPEVLISATNSRGETPLLIAARAGKTNVVELLLPQGASQTHPKSPLCVAVETGDLEVLKCLLEAPNEGEEQRILESSGNFGMSPAHVAIMYQKKDMLTEMWDKKPWLLQLRDAESRNPLHFAACTNYLDGVKFLIEKFPTSALQQDRTDGYLPFHVACMMDHVRIVEELLQQWPDRAEFPSKQQQNIFHVSTRHGSISTIRHILENPKFDHLINARDLDMNTMLDFMNYV